MGVVDEAVQHGIGNGRIAEDVMMPPVWIGWCLVLVPAGR